MKRNTTCTICTLIGTALISFVALFTGCSKLIDYIHTNTFVYHNETSIEVKVEVYENDELKKSWTIEPGKSLGQDVELGVGAAVKYDAIIEYDVARVVFGDSKELWCRKTEQNTPCNIYNPDNMTVTEIHAHHRRYDFHIDDAMMNAATEIESGR